MAHSLDSDEEYAAATEEVSRLAATLSEWETRWRDKQPFLEQHGYMLRPRYHAEWVPSWFHNGLDPESCEDYQPLPVRVQAFFPIVVTDWSGLVSTQPHRRDSSVRWENGLHQAYTDQLERA